MSQIIHTCMLLNTTFSSAQLLSYCLLCALLLSMLVSPEIQHFNYCNIWPDQHRPHGPIVYFILMLGPLMNNYRIFRF